MCCFASVSFSSGSQCRFPHACAGQSDGPESRPPHPPSAPGKEGAGAGKARRPPSDARSDGNHCNGSRSGQPPEMAVVFDASYRPPAKDLQLDSGERAPRRSRRAFHRRACCSRIPRTPTRRRTNTSSRSRSTRRTSICPSSSPWSNSRRGDTPAAIGLLKDTIKAAPKKPQPYLALAYVYFKGLDKADLAQKYAAQALDVDPGNIYVYQYLKEIYTALNQPPKIAALLDRAAKVDSTQRRFLAATRRLIRGILPERRSRQDRPTTSRRRPRSSIKRWRSMAITWTCSRRPPISSSTLSSTPRPCRCIRKSIQIEPDQGSARENLARCYLNSNQRDKAIATLEEMIKQNPVQGHVYGLLGGIYEDGKEFDKASENYRAKSAGQPQSA